MLVYLSDKQPDQFDNFEWVAVRRDKTGVHFAYYHTFDRRMVNVKYEKRYSMRDKEVCLLTEEWRFYRIESDLALIPELKLLLSSQSRFDDTHRLAELALLRSINNDEVRELWDKLQYKWDYC